MKVDVDGIVFMIDVLGNAINNLLFLFLISTEDAIPQDEGCCIVLVNVLLLGTMVNAMIRWCCQDVLNPWMQFADVLRMHPELKQDRYLVCEENNDGMKADESHRQKEKDLD